VAAVRDVIAVSVPLPASGGLVDVFTAHGQTYVRDIQKDLVPRIIAHSGYRWHNAVSRNEMIQILRFLTIRKGGVYVHWDALAARSQQLKSNNVKALGNKIAASHAHAARNHQGYVARAVFKLFQATPDDKKLCFVKEEVFGITDGGPIIGADHPVIMEMFEIPITGALCCSLNLYGLLLLNPLIAAAAALGCQVITNQRFCLRRRNLKRWGKPRCFRTGCIQASKSSSTFSVRTPHYRRQFFPCSFDPVFPLFIRPAFFSGIAGGLFHFKKDHAQYSLKPDDYATKPLFVASKENRFLNEFFLYVLEDLHTCQSLCALQFTSDDPTFVKHIVEGFYPLIPSTATAPEMPPTRAFSRQLVAYIAVFLPVATYFRANDGRISGVCDDQYSATLERLEETCDDAFKLYMTRKTQGWFRRWGTSDAAAFPAPGAAPGAAPGGAGASTPAKDTAPEPSDDDGAELVSPERSNGDRTSSPIVPLETSASRA
jgi:hypothetical protein